MAKPVLTDTRFDFRGGRNTAVANDLLNVNELVDCTNARLGENYGGFKKRTGTRRLHATAIGAPSTIKGVVQWDSTGTKQIVAIANGKLYHKTTEFGAFTELIPPAGDEFSTTEPAFFQPFRASASGAPLILFIASGGKFYKWTGSVLTRIDAVASTPDADRVIAYHTRLFARDINFKKHVFWSKVGDGESWATGTKTDGGSAFVDVLNGEELIAFEVIGSSLLMAAEDSLMRFTGHATDDIVIAQDTEGISPEVGTRGPLCLKRFENVAAMLSERGPYAVTETEVIPIGVKVEPDFATALTTSAIGYHRARRELWFSLGTSVFVYSTRLQAWYGPFTYPFTITYLTRYEDANGAENLIAGCSDGFVRLMDTGQLDDVLSDGTGGSNITLTVELPVISFNAPGLTKALSGMMLQALLPTGSAFQIKHSFDGAAFVTESVASESASLQNYRVDMNNQGKRLRMQFVDASAQSVTINGFVLEAWLYGRP